ncbi:MAG: hypothetical protein AB7S99_10135 [Pseudodonghicola sp.]
MGKVFKDLFLALLNATLILAAICLLLFWKVSATSREVIGEFAGVQNIVMPLREDLRDLTQEVQDMRATLAAVEWLSPEERPAALGQLEQRMTALDTRMEVAQSRLTTLANMPGQMMDRAVETGVDRLMLRAGELRGCHPAAAPTGG